MIKITYISLVRLSSGIGKKRWILFGIAEFFRRLSLFAAAQTPHLTAAAKRGILYKKEAGGLRMKTGIDTIWEDRKRILGMPISMTKYYLSEDRLFVQTG